MSNNLKLPFCEPIFISNRWCFWQTWHKLIDKNHTQKHMKMLHYWVYTATYDEKRWSAFGKHMSKKTHNVQENNDNTQWMFDGHTK